MDPPKISLNPNTSTKKESTEPKWITLVKNILLDKIPLQNESGEALEDQLIISQDGSNAFQYLNTETQDNIVYLLKLYITSSSELGTKPATIQNTIEIFRHLFKQGEYLRKLFYDHVFCRQLIKFLAKKFNSSEIEIAENMRFGAFHEITMIQNRLLNLCKEDDIPEQEFEKMLNQFIKQDHADINFTYFGLKTLLMTIVTTEHPHFVRSLIKAGADSSMKDRDGKTAKDILNEYWPSHLHVLEMPLEYQRALKALMRKKYR